MAEVSINNFSDGMIPDADISIQSKSSYLSAENLRYLASEYPNTGTLHSVESSINLGQGLENNDYIVGIQKIREHVVIFTTNWNIGNRVDKIVRHEVTENTLVYKEVLWSGNDLYMDYSSDPDELPEFLDTVGRYEDSDNIKIYWANSTRSIRMINIMQDNLSYPSDRFDLVTTFDMEAPLLSEIITGSLNSGRVDYAYSLLKENGQESRISSWLAGSKINLFSDNILQASTVDVKGDSESVGTGKGVQIKVNISSDDYGYFDKIRLYRIHYTDYAQVPQIIIVNDFIINNSGSNTLTDSGSSSLGEYTAEEFSILSSVDYSAYTLEEKDNILFAGNVSENVFDVDLDSRAYRFTSGQSCSLYSSYVTDYTDPANIDFTIDGADPTNIGGLATSWLDIPENHNAISWTNDVRQDDSGAVSDCIYQTNGTTIGGEGPNIKYSFDYNSYNVDLDDTATSTEGRTYSGDRDYSDPSIVYSLTGYQRDEIYRFGAVFYDDKGNKTTVKWIGDIRFPGAFSSSTSARNITIGSSVYVMQILFTLNVSLSSIGATSWEIVRAAREETDRTIVDSGYASSTIDYDGNVTGTPYASYKSFVPMSTLNGTWPGGTTINKELVTFISPKSLFNKSTDIKAGDYFDIVGTISNYGSTTYTENGAAYPSNASNRKNSIKYTTNQLYSNATTLSRRTIEEVEYVPLVNDSSGYSFSSAYNGLYFPYCVTPNTTTYLEPGSSVVIQLDSSYSNIFSSYNIPYVQIKRHNPGRYGGYDYQSRLKTNYISAGYVNDSTIISANKGDTYINYFDYLNNVFTETITDNPINIPVADAVSSSVIFPTESKINLSLRHDLHYAKEYGNPRSFLMGESAGVYITPTYSLGNYVQDTDLYLYNSIYSQEQNISYSLSDSDILYRTSFDSRIVYSDKKFDDEYIDSWSKLRINNFLDVESKHGAIRSLIKYNNNLYFSQDSSFGVVSVNQRSLVADGNAGQLALGSGGTLERFDYINEFYGVQNKKAISSNKGGVFFFDKIKKAILTFGSEGLTVLSDNKGFISYLKDLEIRELPFVVSNDINNEVYFQLNDSKVLVYNIFTKNFISNYTLSPKYIADVGYFVVHFKEVATEDSIYGLYLKEDSYGSFDDGNTFNDSKLLINNNEDFLTTKVYDNLIFFSNSNLEGVARNTDKFDSVSYWNDYQYTGSTSLVLGDTLERKERGYTTYIPRNIVNSNGASNIDIFDVSNHNTSRQFRERLRDRYIKAELIYENSGSKGQLSVPYIGFKYRKSIR